MKQDESDVSNANTQARSFAEEGLEEIQQETAAAEAAVPEAANATAGGEEEDLVQVGGLEPIAFFYRTTAPKKTPKQPFKILEKGQVIAGTYERHFVTGKFKNPTYVIRLTDGTLVGLPGAGGLNRAMKKLAEGSKVKITYEGMSTIKGGEWEGNDAHNFTVFGNKLKA